MTDGPFQEDYEDPRLGRDLRLQSPAHNPFRLPSTQEPQISPPTAFVERPRWRAPGPGDEARQTSAEGIKASWDEGDAFGVFQHTFPHVWDLAGGTAGIGIGATRSAKGRALAPWISKMAPAPQGKYFDLSRTGEIDSSVPQTQLPRYDPPRGVSQRTQDLLNNDKVWKEVDRLAKEGGLSGAFRWYGTGPVRDEYMDILGPTKGAKEFKRDMGLQAATSPQMRVPGNIVTGYGYGYMGANNQLPAEGKGMKGTGFGAKAQNLHLQNVKNVLDGTFLDYDYVLSHPKPPSFMYNLMGDLSDIATIDNHAFKGPAMLSRDPRFLATNYIEVLPQKGPDGKNIKRTWKPLDMYMNGELSMDEALKRPTFWEGKPRNNEYAALEDRWREQAHKAGVGAGQYQAGGWKGMGHITGLGSPPDLIWAQMFEDSLLASAAHKDIKPREMMKQLVKRKAPLLPLAQQKPYRKLNPADLEDDGPFGDE